MHLIKKKFEKKKKKAEKKKKEKALKSTASLTNLNKKKKKEKKKKKKKRNSRSRESSSSEESLENSDESDRRLKNVQSKLAVDAANVDRKYRMAGALFKKSEDPPDFARKILEAEWREMSFDSKVNIETVKTLDVYLKNRAELKSTDHVVIAEKVDDDDKKSTVRLKILTKFDEGRFAAIYMVQNESAVDNDVISVGNSRFMMKTALRQLSSHQIVYRLSREITALKALWSKPTETPPRIPPLWHEGKILGVPFYVTQIYDVNLEKCREQMGGGQFCAQSAFHIALEIFMAIKFLHRRNLVHRDIKPTNVVLSYQNRDQWYLIDFGDTITVGKNSALSPPDGQTLPFLSLEAHDALLVPSQPSTFQQDLESWFYLIIDLMKPLPWRDQPKIDKTALAKREFWSRLANRVSDLPPQILEISKLLKTDSPPIYPEISKKLVDGIATFRSGSSSAEKWTPEWYDRASTKKLREREAKKKRSKEASEAQTTVETTEDQPAPNNKNENNRKDRSVYISEMGPAPVATPTNRKKEVSPSKPATSSGAAANRTAVMLDDDPPPPKQSPLKPQERSVYFTDVAPTPSPAADAGGKKKYRYKPRK